MQDKRKEYFSFLSDAYKRHINHGMSWGDLTNEFNELFGENITKNSFRKRCTRYSNADDKEEFENNVSLVESKTKGEHQSLLSLRETLIYRET